MQVSIGVCAFNEEENIQKLLKALLAQKLSKVEIKEIYVISSGSTDKTNQICKDLAKKHKNIKLICQEKRQGKASAINIFLKNASSETLILESADTLPAPNTIEELVAPLIKEQNVGMVGGHPVPTNDPNTFLGYATCLIWELHHRLSMQKPKAGELVAFRGFIKKIPKQTATDEAWIESLVTKQGYSLAYAPDAIVYNHGPETLKDLIKQRKRIFIGHLHLKQKQRYAPLTMNNLHILLSLLPLTSLNPKKIIWTKAAVLIEAYCRIAAIIDYYLLGKNPFTWEVSDSTKKL